MNYKNISRFLPVLILGILLFTGCDNGGGELTSSTVDQTAIEQLPDSGPTFNFGPLFYVILSVAIVLILVILLLPVKLWLKVVSSGYWVWPHSLIAMRLQRIDLDAIVDNFLAARKAGLKVSIFSFESLYLAKADVTKVTNAMIMAHNGHVSISLQELKEHYLSNGDVELVVRAMVSAKNADLNLPPNQRLHLTFPKAAAIDLAGVNVADAVLSYVKPKVLETERITAVAKDGIELTARVRVTIRSNLERIISGADDQTVIATTNEAVVTIIGQSENHEDILENAYEIGERVLRQKEVIYRDLAYDVLSVDISEIEVGKDIKSNIEEEKAKAKLAQEKAREQEMITRAAEANVHRILAESEVQQAMAEAFREGNISVKDYHKLLNTEADTLMRKSFANSPHKDQKEIDD